MNRWSGWILAVALAAAACGDNHELPKPDAAPDATAYDPVARGSYIVNTVAACTFCHTPLLGNGSRDLDRLFAGVDCFIDFTNLATFQNDHNGVGCLSTRNLTNHETGLKLRTDEQIKNAFRNGIRTDGKQLFPIMPYYIFHNMTDEDADAVVAYLRTIPGVDHTVQPNEEPFASYNDGNFAASGFKYVPFLTDTEIPVPQGGANNESAMRGRYLVSSVGLCIDCHTPEVTPNAIRLDMTKAFAGGKLFPKEALGLLDPSFPPFIATRNLTPHMTGLAGWTKEQIKAAIADGKDNEGKQVCAGTHGGVISTYSALEDQDLEGIAEYLVNLAPVDNDTAGMICPPRPVKPAVVGTAESNCAVSAFPVSLLDDDDSDGVANDGCPEVGTDCMNATDDDGDGFVNDGCVLPCGNCQGPPVQ